MPAAERDARIAICSRGEAAWTAAAYAALGARWSESGGLAWGTVVPHPFLLGAVTLQPRPVFPQGLLDGLTGMLRDSWGALGDVMPLGWRARAGDPWMFRPPGPCPVAPVPQVRIERTDDPELFERTSFAANGSAPRRPGELHPAGSQDTPGLHLLLAWRADRPVGSALAFVHPAGVYVSAVAVMAGERRRGIGAALTAAALGTAPDRPATLTASDLGYGVYLGLGFSQVGTPLDWRHDEPRDDAAPC